jgi:hypothetical protein
MTSCKSNQQQHLASRQGTARLGTDRNWLLNLTLQATSSLNTRRRLKKQRQLLARLTAENAELKLKQHIREQEHNETVKRLKHEQTVVLRKVQQLESILEKL